MTTPSPRPRALRPCRLVALALVVALGLVLLSSAIAAAQTARSGPRHAPDSILVRFNAAAPPSERTQAHAMAGVTVHRSFTLVEGLQVVRVPPGMTVKEAIERYQRHPAVLYAEPNWIVHHQASPNDPGFGDMWGLHNTGQSGGVPDADIDAVEAWNLTTGSASVVVAVIDTGIDPNHPDLATNLFRNTTNCNSNGIDDDGNGQIDDCFSINTAANTSKSARRQQPRHPRVGDDRRRRQQRRRCRGRELDRRPAARTAARPCSPDRLRPARDNRAQRDESASERTRNEIRSALRQPAYLWLSRRRRAHRPGGGGGRIRVALGGRSRRAARPAGGRPADGAGHAAARSDRVAYVPRRSHQTHSAGHGRDHPAAAPGAGARQAARFARRALERPADLRARRRLVRARDALGRRALRGARPRGRRLSGGDARGVDSAQAVLQRPVRGVRQRAGNAAPGASAGPGRGRRAHGSGVPPRGAAGPRLVRLRHERG